MCNQQPPKSLSVSSLSLFQSILYTVAQLLFLKHILNSLTPLFIKLRLLSIAHEWTPESSVCVSICTITSFPCMFPKNVLLLTFTHPTQWPNQTHCFLIGPVLSCLWAIVLWAIAYATHHDSQHTSLNPTVLWGPERFPLLHEAFLISKLEKTLKNFFLNFQSSSLVQQGTAEKIWVSSV